MSLKDSPSPPSPRSLAFLCLQQESIMPKNFTRELFNNNHNSSLWVGFCTSKCIHLSVTAAREQCQGGKIESTSWFQSFTLGKAGRLCLFMEIREERGGNREERWQPGPISGPMASVSGFQKAFSQHHQSQKGSHTESPASSFEGR